MAFVLGLVGGAVRHAVKRERENQSSYQDHQSLLRNVDGYNYSNNNNSPYHQQPPCPCLGTHLPQYPCDPYRSHEAHVPVSRREFKRDLRRARRTEQQQQQHIQRAEACRQPGYSSAVPAVVYTDHNLGNTEGSQRRGVIRGTARDLSQNMSNTTAPPAYVGNRRASSDQGDLQDESDAPPPYEQIPVEARRRQSVEVLTSNSRERKMA
ncbi:hypothetical protein PFICI_06967 [Pestalotiopsis fici W106-1]|uniref:Uncharacterized protein n=1 Tax=Pestalotiopsis fici (strain W106-1 / CGMCC3.15140) TaxID=1229662 RepID=W3X7C7_PESFW|nr:uncharacterized protein PFICI_06967 [Pestalotiopsis fici W106-1]ETS81965.1 hypothetical protein PFICI_06967 [Pestalotiopsis fici W106-1]